MEGHSKKKATNFFSDARVNYRQQNKDSTHNELKN